MKKLFIIWIIVVIIGIIGYIKGVIKFANCDFEKPYKAEIIHGIGICCGTGVITGWMNFGK